MGWGGDVNVRLKLNTPLMRRWAWWGGDVNVRLKLKTPLMLRWAWGGVGMWTFVWSWTRHWCDAEHGVGWGGDVNVRLKLNTPLMLRWAWGGVGMWTFVWSWTRHWCDAEHGVVWGGVGMLTFVWSWRRHWCYAKHGVGWGCELRLKLNTPLLLRWAWGDPDQYIRSWQWRWENALCPDLLKKNTGLHAQWSLELARQKKGPDFVWKGCQTQEKWPFFILRFLLWDGYETLKGLSFFDNGDAPTRAIPHPAGCIYSYFPMNTFI